MYIKRLYIDSFGGLSKKEYDFSEGVNIIQGNNESGKSTILSFIKFMLYGAQSKPSGGLSVSERKLFLSWKEGRAAGNMTVEVGGKEYRIERELSIASRVGVSENGKEVFRETVEVINTANGAIEMTRKNPGEVFLGVSEDVFALTALVGQISGVRVNGADICTSIEDLLAKIDFTPDWWSPNYKDVTPENLAWCHEHGIKVVPADPLREDLLGNFFDLGRALKAGFDNDAGGSR